MWEVAWENLNLLSCKQKKIIQFQWKCIHGKHTVDYRKWGNQINYAILEKITQKLYNIYFYNV